MITTSSVVGSGPAPAASAAAAQPACAQSASTQSDREQTLGQRLMELHQKSTELAGTPAGAEYNAQILACRQEYTQERSRLHREKIKAIHQKEALFKATPEGIIYYAELDAYIERNRYRVFPMRVTFYPTWMNIKTNNGVDFTSPAQHMSNLVDATFNKPKAPYATAIIMKAELKQGLAKAIATANYHGLMNKPRTISEWEVTSETASLKNVQENVDCGVYEVIEDSKRVENPL